MTVKTPYTNPDYVKELTGTDVGVLHCELATAIIDNYTGKDFNSQTYSDQVFSGDGSSWLDLGVYPVNEITSVKIDDDEIDSSQYKSPAQHGEADGYLYREDGWPEGTGNIKVTFTIKSSVSPLVLNVASKIASILKNDSSVENIRSESIGQYSVTYLKDESFGSKTKITRELELLPKEANIASVGGVAKPQNKTIHNPRYYEPPTIS